MRVFVCLFVILFLAFRGTLTGMLSGALHGSQMVTFVDTRLRSSVEGFVQCAKDIIEAQEWPGKMTIHPSHRSYRTDQNCAENSVPNCLGATAESLTTPAHSEKDPNLTVPVVCLKFKACLAQAVYIRKEDHLIRILLMTASLAITFWFIGIALTPPLRAWARVFVFLLCPLVEILGRVYKGMNYNSCLSWERGVADWTRRFSEPIADCIHRILRGPDPAPDPSVSWLLHLVMA